MQTKINRFIVTAGLAAALAGVAAGCESTKPESAQKREEKITLAQMSSAARAAVEKETAGGKVDDIVKEVERGKVVYDVEATVGGKHVEFLIADADGAILGRENEIEVSQLPEPVR